MTLYRTLYSIECYIGRCIRRDIGRCIGRYIGHYIERDTGRCVGRY